LKAFLIVYSSFAEQQEFLGFLKIRNHFEKKGRDVYENDDD